MCGIYGCQKWYFPVKLGFFFPPVQPLCCRDVLKCFSDKEYVYQKCTICFAQFSWVIKKLLRFAFWTDLDFIYFPGIEAEGGTCRMVRVEKFSHYSDPNEHSFCSQYIALNDEKIFNKFGVFHFQKINFLKKAPFFTNFQCRLTV